MMPAILALVCMAPKGGVEYDIMAVSLDRPDLTLPPDRVRFRDPLARADMMRVYGLDSIRSELESGGYTVKCLAHDQAVVFFPRTTEHRDAGISGLSYKDDSKGNALAGIMSPGRIEFRYHSGFSDERVKHIVLAMMGLPDLSFAKGFKIIYQGRVLIDGQ